MAAARTTSDGHALRKTARGRRMSLQTATVAILFSIAAPTAHSLQDNPAWGESLRGVQLRVDVADGPVPVMAGGVLLLQAQLRNQGARPVTFVGEAIVHPDIEIDDVWYAPVWAGSCCSSPREIPGAGGKSAVFPIRVIPSQTFASGVTPARTLDLAPGRHSIRIRTISRESIYLRQGADSLVLTSNAVVVDVPLSASRTPVPSATPPACVEEAGRRSEWLHGAVERREQFSTTTGAGWVVRLEPIEYGWMLRIATKDRATEDLSSLTPPWHGVPNPRELEGWHFRNAGNTGPNDASVNAPGSLREFIFSPLVGREIEYSGGATSTSDVDRVRSFGRGWLFLESYRLTPARSGGRAAFESLTFWACLTWPQKGAE